jgi:hypothetical protein
LSEPVCLREPAADAIRVSGEPFDKKIGEGLAALWSVVLGGSVTQ